MSRLQSLPPCGPVNAEPRFSLSAHVELHAIDQVKKSFEGWSRDTQRDLLYLRYIEDRTKESQVNETARIREFDRTARNWLAMQPVESIDRFSALVEAEMCGLQMHKRIEPQEADVPSSSDLQWIEQRPSLRLSNARSYINWLAGPRLTAKPLVRWFRMYMCRGPA